MKTKLYITCNTFDFESLFKRKGYAFFTNGIYNLNIIGVRHNNTDNVVTNVFDDLLIVDYDTEVYHKRQIYTITTKPGLTSLKNPINPKGTGILVPGQYRGVYAVALHNGKYEALCQRNGPVKVYRDGNKDGVYDMYPETIDKGYFGVNIHRANKYNVTEYVNNYSAACQVFNDPKEFESFMRLVKKAKDIWGNKFTYTLINEEDLYV